MQRRAFLASTLLGLGDLALPAGADDQLQQIADLIGRLRVRDTRLGSTSVVMPAYWLAGRLSRAVANTAPDRPDYQRVAELAVEASELAGWTSFEVGDHRGALTWYDRAIRLSGGVKDRDIAALAPPGRAAVLWLGVGDPSAALHQLAKMDLGGVSPKVRAIVHGARASALASAGDQRSLRAIDATKAVATDDGPAWTGWRGSPAHAESLRGIALLDLGFAGPAYEVLAGVLRRLPPGLKRVTGKKHSDLALAALRMGEPEQAATHVLEASRIFRAMQSQKAGDLAKVTDELFTSYSDLPAIRELAEQLRDDTRYVLCRTMEAKTRVHHRSCAYARRGRARPWAGVDLLSSAELASEASRNGYELCRHCLPA